MATDIELNGADPEPSLRDALDAAFEQASTDEAPEAADKAASELSPAEQRARDERGRFAAKTPTDTEPAAKAPGQAQGATLAPTGTQAPPTGAPAPTDLKPPASWRPEAREKWASVDPLIREEVHRREFEAQRVLQQGAQARQFIEQFTRTVAPYEVFIRQENSNPLQAIQSLMQTAADLRVGTPQHKASLVAGLVKQYAVDLHLLDSALAGVVLPNGQQQQPMHDPRFDQFLMAQQQMLAQNREREEAELRTTLETFASKHEFYTDVRDTMADLIEIRGRRGDTNPDLEKIYAEACKMNESVSTILATRVAAQKAGHNSLAVLRAKRAASSVKGDPTPHDGATVPQNDSIRAALEAAFEQSNRV